MSFDLAALVSARRLALTGEGRRLREAAGLTLGDVAKATGVDPTTVARWERGGSVPRSEAAIRWAEALHEATAALNADLTP